MGRRKPPGIIREREQKRQKRQYDQNDQTDQNYQIGHNGSTQHTNNGEARKTLPTGCLSSLNLCR